MGQVIQHQAETFIINISGARLERPPGFGMYDQVITQIGFHPVQDIIFIKADRKIQNGFVFGFLIQMRDSQL